ncbi:MAG: hypothetical protein IJ735_01210 [Clostridia bacterium]|nr:hypothetical protein [Clostridia bacterium]
MKYLSFDIECCDGKHICEFGYVLFDESFGIIEKECLLINPEHRITLSGKKSRGDMTLCFSDKEYFAAPTFPHRYETIRALLYAPDTVIVGFSLQNDVGFLATACADYGLPPLKFRYKDFQRLYRGYTHANKDVSVGGFVEELGIEGIRFHKSDDDAYAVVLGLQKIAEKEGLNLAETLLMMEEERQKLLREVAREKAKKRLAKIVEGNKKVQNGFLRNYVQKLKRNKQANNAVFSGKVVCIGSSLQKERFSDFVALLDRLYAAGACYTPRTSAIQIFITYDETEDARYNSAKICAQSGKEILFLPFAEALDALGATEEDLRRIDLVPLFYEEPQELSEVKTSKGGATVGQILQNKPNPRRRRRRGGKKHKNPVSPAQNRPASEE